ncbi:DUF2057 family protein [Vibrio sp. S4M6]|uniref:DUF2057 family protein n=1 Tax=Vibrio sinus TaxID=2946865 RepID=UPI00202A65FD|nr:DUF2057 family protein [Vibrio sinus]MCL9781691.1 DUF2057 family protein [Vibrio sinus]
MKLIKPLSFLLAMVFSTVAMAKVTITVPDTVEMLAVNSASPELEGGMFSANKTLTLPNGENQIVFKYAPYFAKGKDRVTVESQAIIAKFNAKDTKLNFEFSKFNSLSKAQKNINSLEWSLVDQSGHKLDIQQDRLIKKGMQIGRNYPQEAQNYNTKGGVAAIVTPLTLTQRALKQGDLKQMQGKNTAEEMLHFWYAKADAATKARFKHYVEQH